ncbi:MAG: diacylglycerol kinase family protein [Pirellulales bacterium]
MADEDCLPPQTWGRKFHCAFRGIKRGFRSECSFFAHLFVAAAVVTAGFALGADRYEWYALLLCITIVLTTEMLNTAIERLAKAVTGEIHPHVRDALDMASGAVLLAAIGSVVLGTLVLGRLALRMCGTM